MMCNPAAPNAAHTLFSKGLGYRFSQLVNFWPCHQTGAAFSRFHAGARFGGVPAPKTNGRVPGRSRIEIGHIVAFNCSSYASRIAFSSPAHSADVSEQGTPCGPPDRN